MRFLSRRRVGPRQTCLLCHDSSADKGLCRACLDDLLLLAADSENLCPRCGGRSTRAAVCGQCQQKPPPADAVWTSLQYAPPLSGMLHQFKHKRDLSLLQPLAGLMRALPPPWLANAGIDAVLAVPLSRERRLFRGFNQCDELVRLLAPDYGWNVLPHTAVFRQASVPQSTLDFEQRRKNIRGVFKTDLNVKKYNVLLMDDVVTSGTTLNELARELKRAGAGRVFCWALANAKVQKVLMN